MRLIRPRLITFDVTGTLLMTKVSEYYENIGAQYGLEIDTAKLAPSFKSVYKQMTKEHPIYGKHTGLGWENWWRAVVYKVFEDQNSKISQQTLYKIATSLIDDYKTSKCWHTYPGTHELLEYLAKRDVILGVISNFDERLESILVETNIRSYFSFVITSYRFGVEKPDPRIFEEAIRLSKYFCKVKISPQEALHIGDSVEFDYFGAKKAGWGALLVNNENQVDKEQVPKEIISANVVDLKRRLEKVL